MGYRGKLTEQHRARELRARGMAMTEIAERLGVAKSSVSKWTSDINVPPAARRQLRTGTTNRLRLAKLAEIEECNRWGAERLGVVAEEAFLAAGAALYAGEGGKTDGAVVFANTDPAMFGFFLDWFRTFFDVDERRLRLALYLHEGLDLAAANAHWERVTGIPEAQFTKPYRAVVDSSIRSRKHPFGCPRVSYHCAVTHRLVMGLVRGLLASYRLPG